MSFNFFHTAKENKATPIEVKKSKQTGIIAVYKNGGFYAKVSGKLYYIDNYKLVNGKVYSKPENDQHIPWTMKELTNKITIDNYMILAKMWASLYDGQVITGVTQNGGFILKSKTDKLF